jgi:chromosome partitioning protein
MGKDGEKKPVVVSLSSIKGGVGKTNITILLANCLASAGKRVLLIESDLNNSLSFYYLGDTVMLEETKKRNIAAALSNEGNDLSDYALPTTRDRLDLIASSAYLSDLRTLSEKRLARMTGTLAGKYDVVIIDCHPTYDNIVLNALHAADYIITPVLKDLFSYNAAVFLSEVLPRDTEKAGNWFILVNGYDRRYEEARDGRQREYVGLYEKAGLPLLPREAWFPWTAQIRDVVDYHKYLSCREGISGSFYFRQMVYNPGLHNAAAALAGCFFDEALSVPEVF